VFVKKRENCHLKQNSIKEKRKNDLIDDDDDEINQCD